MRKVSSSKANRTREVLRLRFPDLRAVEEERAAMSIPQEDKIADYYNLRQQLDIFNKDLHDVLCHPTYALPFLQPGRLVHVKHDEQDWGWGVVVNYNKRMGVKGRPLPEDEPPQNTYIVDVLLHVDVTTTQKGAKKNQMLTSSSSLQPCPPDGKGEFQVVPVLLGLIQGISHIRIFLPKDLKPIEPREQAFKHVQEVKRRFKNAIALLDPIEHMSIHDEQFKKLVKVRSNASQAISRVALTVSFAENRDTREQTRSESSRLITRAPRALRAILT